MARGIVLLVLIASFSPSGFSFRLKKSNKKRNRGAALVALDEGLKSSDKQQLEVEDAESKSSNQQQFKVEDSGLKSSNKQELKVEDSELKSSNKQQLHSQPWKVVQIWSSNERPIAKLDLQHMTEELRKVVPRLKIEEKTFSKDANFEEIEDVDLNSLIREEIEVKDSIFSQFEADDEQSAHVRINKFGELVTYLGSFVVIDGKYIGGYTKFVKAIAEQYRDQICKDPSFSLCSLLPWKKVQIWSGTTHQSQEFSKLQQLSNAANELLKEDADMEVEPKIFDETVSYDSAEMFGSHISGNTSGRWFAAGYISLPFAIIDGRYVGGYTEFLKAMALAYRDQICDGLCRVIASENLLSDLQNSFKAKITGIGPWKHLQVWGFPSPSSKMTEAYFMGQELKQKNAGLKVDFTPYTWQGDYTDWVEKAIENKTFSATMQTAATLYRNGRWDYHPLFVVIDEKHVGGYKAFVKAMAETYRDQICNNICRILASEMLLPMLQKSFGNEFAMLQAKAGPKF